MCPLPGGQGCTAATASGSPCKNLAVKGLQVCRWHGDEKSLSRDQVSLDILKPGVKRHLAELKRAGVDAHAEIARLRAWRDYVEDYINRKTKGNPSPEQVKVLIEANKSALNAVEAQTRIEYNKANVITQKDAAQFIATIISIARQTIHSHKDLLAFLEATNRYFNPERVSSIARNGDTGEAQD